MLVINYQINCWNNTSTVGNFGGANWKLGGFPNRGVSLYFGQGPGCVRAFRRFSLSVLLKGQRWTGQIRKTPEKMGQRHEDQENPPEGQGHLFPEIARGFKIWCLVSAVDFLVDFWGHFPWKNKQGKKAAKNPPKNPWKNPVNFWPKSTQGNCCLDRRTKTHKSGRTSPNRESPRLKPLCFTRFSLNISVSYNWTYHKLFPQGYFYVCNENNWW